jgi:hypothetical protein
MAKHDFYDPIDLHQKELLNVRLQALLNLPTDPFEGQICYHSISSKKLGAIYNGTEWRYFGLPPLGKSYDSQALMLADQVNQLPDYAYFDGLKEWRKLETSTGVIDDYREIGGGGGAVASITTIGASASTDPSLFKFVNVVLVSNTKITLIGTYETTIAFQTIYRVKQAYSGGRILTWDGKTVIWQGGQVPIVDTEANSVTFISLYWDGSDLYGYKSCGF